MRLQLVVASIALVTSGTAFFAACGDSSFDASTSDASFDGSVADGAPQDSQSPDAVTIHGDAASGADACAPNGGPTTVSVKLPNGEHYCVDSTEVTREQYAAFGDAIAHGYTPPGDPRCNWNTSFAIGTTCAATLPDNGLGAPAAPMTCIDWCDAFSFCAWTGRRLCGTIGSRASLSPNSEATDKNTSQWEYACTANGTRTFPYSGGFIDGGCNVAPASDGGLAPVGAFGKCVGGYDGIYDMAGNASEWVNACNDIDGGDPSLQTCVRIGGSYLQTSQVPPAGHCNDYTSNIRLDVGKDVGFRCCSGEF